MKEKVSAYLRLRFETIARAVGLPLIVVAIVVELVVDEKNKKMQRSFPADRGKTEARCESNRSYCCFFKCF
jgi:hypothetical protein